MAEKMYVSSISQGAVNPRRQIPAGTPFLESALIPKTFAAFVKKGYITEVGIGPAPVIIKPLETTVIGLPQQTPSAAITPPVVPTSEDTQDVSERDAIIVELTALAVPFNLKSKTKTLRKLLKKVKAAIPTPVPDAPLAITPLDALKAASVGPASVWNFNLEDLVEKPLEQLLAMYKERCTEYEKTMEMFTDKDLLIEKMTSEVNK
jgi:hypothetical protein